VENDGVPVGVSEGFIKSFAAPFLERFGEDSLFVRTVSDYWTSALARMLIAKGKISDADPVALFSDPDALAAIVLLSKDEALKEPLFQEPMGFAAPGAIESSFDAAYGPASFRKWLSAFEKREFELCGRIAQRSV
jgi:hypothetical protein